MMAMAALVFCSMHAAWWHSRAGSTLQPDVDLQHPERVLATRRRVDKLFYDCMIRAECHNGSCRRVRVTRVGCACICAWNCVTDLGARFHDVRMTVQIVVSSASSVAMAIR